MYDELVKRLRESKNEKCYIGCFGNCVSCKIDAELEQAADAIEELICEVADEHNARLDAEERQRWIPATERLPEDIDEEVLVCTEDYGVSGLGFVTVATYGVSGWLECWERKTYLTAVTHWMPLPTPPQAEESE